MARCVFIHHLSCSRTSDAADGIFGSNQSNSFFSRNHSCLFWLYVGRYVWLILHLFAVRETHGGGEEVYSQRYRAKATSRLNSLLQNLTIRGSAEGWMALPLIVMVILRTLEVIADADAHSIFVKFDIIEGSFVDV